MDQWCPRLVEGEELSEDWCQPYQEMQLHKNWGVLDDMADASVPGNFVVPFVKIGNIFYMFCQGVPLLKNPLKIWTQGQPSSVHMPQKDMMTGAQLTLQRWKIFTTAGGLLKPIK